MKVCPKCKTREPDDRAVFCGMCGYRFLADAYSGDNHLKYSSHDISPEKTLFHDPGLTERYDTPENGKGRSAGDAKGRYDDAGPARGRYDGSGTGARYDRSTGRDRYDAGTAKRSGPDRAADRYAAGYDVKDYESGKRKDNKEGRDISFSNQIDTDKPRRSVWPLVAGLLAAAIIAGTAFYYFISIGRIEKKQKAEIDRLYSDVETIYNRQKNEYLDDALKDWQGETFYDKATDTKEDDNLSNEQKISALKSILDDFRPYDDSLAKAQKEQLDKSFDKAKGKYNKEFLIEGEQDQLDQFEKDYSAHTDERNFKAAKADIESYSELEKKIMNDDEEKVNYSAEKILNSEEFMPATLDFSVDTEAYTADGKEMSASHFTLIEQIGRDGKQKYIRDISVSDLEIDGGEARYQLSFSPGKPEDYKTDRLYILHVRRQDGSRGFTAQQGTNPEKLILAATSDYMEEFVKAFNEDCSENSRTFSAMASYLENDSQAYNDYKGLPGLPSVYNEQIEDASGTDIKVTDDGKSVHVTTTFAYFIVRDRELEQITDSTAERSYYYDGENKDFGEETYEDKDYIFYSKDNGATYNAQEKSSHSSFKVYEHLSEYNTFDLRITDNTSVGPIYKHSNDAPSVTKVEGMEYNIDPDKEIYTQDDLFPEEEEDADGVSRENEDYYDDDYEGEDFGDDGY